MARPWQMTPWPYLCKDGRKSWRVGYRDHEGTVRGKAFASAHAARQWMSDFQDAERRGQDSLMRFVLDLDAKEQNAAHKGLVLGEVVQLYLAHNGPEEEEGLSRATFENYRHTANLYLLGHPRHTPRHEELPPHPFAQKMGLTPIAAFNDPRPSRAFWDEMLRAGVAKEARAHARRVFSAILSWAASTDLVPELHTNGCKLANEQRSTRRRSARRSSGGAGRRRHGAGAASWALSALAVEHIRAELLRRTNDQRPLLRAQRDAMVVSLQYGLAARNQEAYGLRQENAKGALMHFVEVVARGCLDEGKTEGSTPRTCLMPACLIEDLSRWRNLLEEAGHDVGPRDFIIPGDLAGARYGLTESDGDGCHFTHSQAVQWGPKYFQPAVMTVAKTVAGLESIAGAVPYSLRRGGMTARVRSEDAQMVVGECGTSLDMLNRHYSFALAEYRGKGPQSFDEIWREAREQVFGSGDPLLPPPLPLPSPAA
jgi:hypothetical protein